MIYTWRHIRSDLALEADLCVIGSGAGGAPVAREVQAAGKRVVVLEAGSFLTPADFSQLEHEMFPKLYHQKAGRTTGDKAVRIHQGKGVGGSTLHNLNLCKRIPDEVAEGWRARYGLAGLPAERLDALYDEVERDLNVAPLEERHLNGNNRVFKRGIEALGYRGGFLHHNRQGCLAAGFCELGCPFDAKQNALKVYIAQAVEQGCEVMADTWATRIVHAGRRAHRVLAVVRHPDTGAELHQVTIDARAVCVSASATATPVLLQRSEVPDPGRLVGSRIHLHPGAGVAGVFRERLSSWIGVPQSYECTEWLDFTPGSGKACWIVPAFAHPAGVSAMLSGFGSEHARHMKRYPHMAALSPMVHDQSPGRVSPTRKDPYGVRVDYWIGEEDRAQLKRGLVESARILLAAGAERVIVPFARTLEVAPGDDVDALLADVEIRRHDLELAAVHPMASVWMGDSERSACVDSYGRYHWLDNLYVSDTSLFPSSIGVPPQLSAYALGLHVGRRIAAEL